MYVYEYMGSRTLQWESWYAVESDFGHGAGNCLAHVDKAILDESLGEYVAVEGERVLASGRF